MEGVAGDIKPMIADAEDRAEAAQHLGRPLDAAVEHEVGDPGLALDAIGQRRGWRRHGATIDDQIGTPPCDLGRRRGGVRSGEFADRRQSRVFGWQVSPLGAR